MGSCLEINRIEEAHNGISLFSITLAVTVLLCIERLRISAEESFGRSISKTDLIVAAAGSPLNTLLYLVFHMGEPIKNIEYAHFKELSAREGVAWTLPISLGDSYLGYRVVGTSEDLFKHFKFGRGETLSSQSGVLHLPLFGVVLGHEVAKAQNLGLGDEIILSHGYSSAGSFEQHDLLPFKVEAVLNPSQTPYDRAVIVSLESLEAIHVDWQSGAQAEEMTPKTVLEQMDLTPKTITGFLVGARSRFDVLSLQRIFAQYEKEALLAVLPGVALSEFWNLVGMGAKALVLVTACVAVVGLLSMFLSIYVTLADRRKEMAIFRSLGAPKRLVLFLFVAEAGLITGAGALLGLLLSKCVLAMSTILIGDFLGIRVDVWALGPIEQIYLISLFGLGTMIGLIPALQAYREQLYQGLSTQ